MALTLRHTPLEKSSAFADLVDWQVLDDGKPVGRIYQKHAPASPDQAWFWSITEYVDMPMNKYSSLALFGPKLPIRHQLPQPRYSDRS